MHVQIMNSANISNKNIVHSVSIYNDSAAMNTIFKGIIPG